MKKLLVFSLLTLGCLVALVTAGCNNVVAAARSGPDNGSQCTVQFRRDALGSAAALPVPPMTGSINGADTAVEGKLVMSTDEWIVLAHSNGEIWIPKSVILLIQAQRK